MSRIITPDDPPKKWSLVKIKTGARFFALVFTLEDAFVIKYGKSNEILGESVALAHSMTKIGPGYQTRFLFHEGDVVVWEP